MDSETKALEQIYDAIRVWTDTLSQVRNRVWHRRRLFTDLRILVAHNKPSLVYFAVVEGRGELFVKETA